jgi:hypothetical protein
MLDSFAGKPCFIKTEHAQRFRHWQEQRKFGEFKGTKPGCLKYIALPHVLPEWVLNYFAVFVV